MSEKNVIPGCSTFCALREKEVIDLCSGSRLGYICDVEIERCTGRICALILPGESNAVFFKRGECVRIPWDRIECIGDDAILVRKI